MAKATQIPYDRGSHAGQWLARVISVRFDEVVDHGPAALEEADVKGVHDMRVAVRRLRTVLGDLEEIAGKLDIKHSRKDLKKLSDLLGSVRDQDVAIIALKDFLAEHESSHTAEGIRHLIAERRMLRRSAHDELAKTFSLAAVHKLRDDLKTAIGDDTPLGLAAVESAGRDVIAARLAELRKYEGSIYNPNGKKALHRLRVRCKRLRYAIELFAGCFGDALPLMAKEIARLQSRLGDVHDYDLWIGGLGSRLEHGNADTADGNPDREAAVQLLSEFVKKRTRAYRSSLKLWRDWETHRFFNRLEHLVTQDA